MQAKCGLADGGHRNSRDVHGHARGGAIEIVVFASMGIALCAASAAAINHLADQHIDAIMARTAGRPMVKGKIDSQGAAIFAFILGPWEFMYS